MAVPSQEIVARPMIARACGCLQEFQQYAVDKYRAQRLAKFQKTRCAACVAKLNEEQQKAAAALPKRGELLQLIPVGSQISLTRREDGLWTGSLTAEGVEVKADGEGTQGLITALARLWATAKGIKPQTDSPAAKPPAARPAAAAPKPAPRPASAPPRPFDRTNRR